MTGPEHPAWCDLARCSVAGPGGMHESAPARVTGRRGKGPRLVLLLVAPATGSPVRLRLVVIGDLLVNTIDLDLDTAALLGAWIGKLLALAAPTP